MDSDEHRRRAPLAPKGVLVGIGTYLSLVIPALSLADRGISRLIVLGAALTVALLMAVLCFSRLNRLWSVVAKSAISVILCAILVYLALDPMNLRQRVSVAAPSASTLCGALVDGRSVNGTWGPSRSFFTAESPAARPTLDSITDNPNIGDERTFFVVKQESVKEAGGWCNSVRVKDGDVLLFRIYVENSAGLVAGQPEDYNAARGVSASVASDDEPSTLRSLTAYLSARNTTPSRIWSNIDISSDVPFRLNVISGSTKVYSNASRDNVEGKGAGRTVHDVLSEPLVLGFDQDDGVILPEYKYALYIVFETRVSQIA